MLLFAVMPIGALLLDQEQRVLAANQAFLDLLGYTEDQVLGRSLTDLLLSNQASDLDGLPDAARARRVADVCFMAARGGTLRARVSFSPFTEGSEASPRLLAVIIAHDAAIPTVDPDRAREAESDLRVDEALAFARVANWELSVATGRVRVSRTWYDIWGVTPGEDITLDVLVQRIHPDDRAALLQAIQRASESGTPFQVRYRILYPDGSIIWAESTGRMELNGSQPGERMYGVVMDITERHEAEQALARYSDIVSASSDRIAFVDRGCRVRAVNAAFLQALARSREEVIGHPFRKAVGRGSLGEFLYRHLGRCLDTGQSLIDDIHEPTPDGRIRDSEVRLFPHRNDQDGVTGIVINIRDVTKIREAERRLLQSAAVYAATSEGVLITDAAGVIVAVNDAFTRITGYTEAEVLGRKPNLLNSQWHPASFFIGMWRRLLRQGSWQGEIWNRRKDGEIYLQRLTIRRVLDARGNLANFVGVFAERGATPMTPQRAEYLAHYDPLTKLPNRLLFNSRLEHAIDLGHRKRSPVALFLLDLDHFSHINTSLGHQIGDELLRAVSLRLREGIRPSDTLARLSGNQFGLLFEEIHQTSEVTEIAQRLRASLRLPMLVRGHQVFVTASIGIAFDVGTGNDRDIMIAHAELALRQVKQDGRDGFRIYTGQPGDAAHERQRLIGLLRGGLDKGEYLLHYCPRVDIETGTWTGVEALIRWHQSRLGPVSPERFLPLADDTGFMVELGQWALGEACRQLRDWLRRGLPLKGLSMNVTEAQLTRFDLVRAVERLLAEQDLVAERLELEFSETLLLKHREQATEVLNGLHRLGVRLMLNEVGAGWIAPAVLRRLPIGALKIHRTFIESLPDSRDDLDVVQALIAMAQALDLDILADGVRTDGQRLLLLNLGCLRGQGDLFAPPLSAVRFESQFGVPSPPARSGSRES